MFSPWTDLALTGSSHTDVAIHDPVFRPEVFVMLAANYLGDANPKDIRAAPIFGVPDGLPPLAIQVGSDELLLDDARCYAVLAAAKGGEVRLDVFEGMHHVFQRCVEDLACAHRAFDLAADFLTTHWS